jgi:hypothetical protein
MAGTPLQWPRGTPRSVSLEPENNLRESFGVTVRLRREEGKGRPIPLRRGLSGTATRGDSCGAIRVG